MNGSINLPSHMSYTECLRRMIDERAAFQNMVTDSNNEIIDHKNNLNRLVGTVFLLRQELLDHGYNFATRSMSPLVSDEMKALIFQSGYLQDRVNRTETRLRNLANDHADLRETVQDLDETISIFQTLMVARDGWVTSSTERRKGTACDIEAAKGEHARLAGFCKGTRMGYDVHEGAGVIGMCQASVFKCHWL